MKKIYFLISFIGILLFSHLSVVNVYAKPGLDPDLPHIHEILEEQAPPNIYYKTVYHGNGRYTDYTYDGNGNLIYSEYFTGWRDELTQKSYYQYDANGNLILLALLDYDDDIKDFTVQRINQFEYVNNLLVREYETSFNYSYMYNSDISQTSTTVYEYNNLNQLIKQYPIGEAYNEYNLGETYEYAYNELGQLILINVFFDDCFYLLEYDEHGNCIKCIVQDYGGSLKRVYTYIYNEHNHMIESTRYDVSSNDYTTTTAEYEYDDYGRLSTYDYSTKSYYFDENGEKISKKSNNDNYGYETYCYNPNGEVEDEEEEEDFDWSIFDEYY